ncbi:MAG TPA: hypothetical protein VNH11_07235 [Pirellulales bacterium]|nr:hypothetical protein [Pirellulales bacterium]
MAENGEPGPGADDDVAPGEPGPGGDDALPHGEVGPGGDDALVLALATGATLDEAAARAGCSARTVSRRLANAQFARRVSVLRGQLFSAATGRLVNNAALAADKLVALLDCPQDHVAYAAARTILELGTKLREAGELEQRIAALEGGAPEQDEGETDDEHKEPADEAGKDAA